MLGLFVLYVRGVYDMKRLTSLEQFLLILTIATGIVITLIFIRTPQLFINRAQAPICPFEGATCLWFGQKDITKYHFVVSDLTTSTIIKEGDTASISVKFTPSLNHRYRCEVSAVNECGAGLAGQVEAICSDTGSIATSSGIVQLPLTGSESASDSATPAAILTETPTPTSTNTPTPISVSTSPTTDTTSPTLSIPSSPTLTPIAPTPPPKLSTFAGWRTPAGATELFSYATFLIVILTIILAIIRKKKK
jgi:hypothetical protein